MGYTSVTLRSDLGYLRLSLLAVARRPRDRIAKQQRSEAEGAVLVDFSPDSTRLRFDLLDDAFEPQFHLLLNLALL